MSNHIVYGGMAWLKIGNIDPCTNISCISKVIGKGMILMPFVVIYQAAIMELSGV